MLRLRNQKGFTLIELSIVLVIIGIILGAVLKGQELINNAKIRRAVSQQKETMSAIYTYYDKYGKYPGDDNTATTRWAGVTNGDSDGTIEGVTIATNFTCTAASAVEGCQIWRHLRNANIIAGDSASALNPNSVFGGTIGIGSFAVQGLTTNWIGLNNIPFDVCQIIDQQNDDGVYNTGSIRGSGNYNTATTGNFNIFIRL